MTEIGLKDWISARVGEYVNGKPLWGEVTLVAYLALELFKEFPTAFRDPAPITDLEDAPLSVDEAAVLLRVSPSTLYKWTSNGTIPHYKPSSRMLYFKRTELLTWAYSKKMMSSQELEKLALGIRKR